MRDTRRCLATGQRHDTRHCSGRDRRLARIARLVAQPSIRPRFGETLLLAPNHRPTDIHPSRHSLHRPTIRRSKNDLRTLDMLAWQVAIRSNRLKSPSVRRAQPNAYCLCHPRSFARRQPHCESAECVSALAVEKIDFPGGFPDRHKYDSLCTEAIRRKFVADGQAGRDHLF